MVLLTKGCLVWHVLSHHHKHLIQLSFPFLKHLRGHHVVVLHQYYGCPLDWTDQCDHLSGFQMVIVSLQLCKFVNINSMGERVNLLSNLVSVSFTISSIVFTSLLIVFWYQFHIMASIMFLNFTTGFWSTLLVEMKPCLLNRASQCKVEYLALVHPWE